MRDLNRFVVPRIKAYWREVAYALHYKKYTLDDIENKDRDRACTVFFENWLSTDNGKSAGPKTWSTLLDAIKEIKDLTSVREEILKDLNIL